MDVLVYFGSDDISFRRLGVLDVSLSFFPLYEDRRPPHPVISPDFSFPAKVHLWRRVDEDIFLSYAL